MPDLGRWSKSVLRGERGGGGGGGGGGHQVGSMTAEFDYGYVRHNCSTDDVMKNQEK